ncbi:MAG TPA: hypothetical protein VM122_07490 [Usitatibacter sp.]|nr:hypothetical protein [Usitatibacter sp.]
MVENHYYADVNLPNHVWVRERAGARSRWVLRDASELKGRPAGSGAEGASQGRKPGAPLQVR